MYEQLWVVQPLFRYRDQVVFLIIPLTFKRKSEPSDPKHKILNPKPNIQIPDLVKRALHPKLQHLDAGANVHTFEGFFVIATIVPAVRLSTTPESYPMSLGSLNWGWILCQRQGPGATVDPGRV